MSKAIVEVVITTTVQITDGGYLRNASIEDHIAAAKREARQWYVAIDKHPGNPYLKNSGYKQVPATIEVKRVILVEGDD